MRGFDAAALDRYLTCEPPEPDDLCALRCSACGRFLKDEPDGVREFVAVRRCSGEPHVFEGTHSEPVLAIIGEEYRGRKFLVAYPPECGGRTASHERQGDGADIGPEEVDGFRHEPHFFAEDEHYAAGVRLCRCGATNEDP